MKVRNQLGTTNSIEVTEGVLQGEILSPTIFALFIADLKNFLLSKGIRGISVTKLAEILLLAYADDIVILVDSPAMMKRTLKVLFEYCEKNALKVNLKKTEIIVFKKGGKIKSNISFCFGKDSIKIVNRYTYLGITFTSSGLFENAAKDLVKKANVSALSTIKLITYTRLDSWAKCKRLFESLVTSIILYSSPIWSIRHIDLLEKLQCQFFKKLLNLPPCTPNYYVRLINDLQSMSTKNFKLILNWINCILIMSDEMYPKICFLD